jgi:O-antigen ligase
VARALASRHPQLVLLGAGALGCLILLPTLSQPLYAIALVGAAGAIWLASRSVAYPLALAGVPTIIEAIVGHNPLPKGAVTFIFAGWIAVAVAFAIARGTHPTAGRGLVSPTVLLSLTLLGVMILRLGPSPSHEYGSTKVQLYIADNLVFLIGAVFVGARREDLRLFFAIVLAVAVGEGTVLLLKLLSGNIHMTFEGRFALSAQEYPIYLGRDSADGLIIAIYAVLTATRTWTRMAAVAALPLLTVAMLAAGSRGPVVACLIGVIVLVVLTSTRGRSRRRLLLAGGGLLGAMAIVPLVLPGSAIGRALSAIVGGAGGLATNGRSALWEKAFTGFGQHPLFGLGTGGFASLNPPLPYPHNILLEAGVELGIVGVLLVAGIVFSAARRLYGVWRTSGDRDRIDAAVLAALFVAALINALVSGAIQDNKEIWLWGGLAVGMSTRLMFQRQPGTVFRQASALTTPYGGRWDGAAE